MLEDTSISSLNSNSSIISQHNRCDVQANWPELLELMILEYQFQVYFELKSGRDNFIYFHSDFAPENEKTAPHTVRGC